ncbi:serine hydrolase domain-containing protein [Rhodocytophaga rosea]|uniref:serine hydrolase domain-containing protein n=1 Tax=Rhodocytophaga rosea TaxID=2704465 RepID=UPI001E40C8E3|nr:serine hydrolase [Rhodocytophaga rosea]
MVWFAQEKRLEDSLRARLTLKNLLTMQPGWEWNDFGPVVNIFINAADPVRFTMDLPFATTPGTQWVYCSAATSVFSAALQKAVKMDLRSFGDKYLFAPAGMKLSAWYKDPAGHWVGASEMHMTSRDLLRFALLYLHHGKVGTKQLLPVSWVKESLSQQAVLDFWDILPGANGYGYYWWRRITNGHQAYIASGAMGQIITIIPDLDMVVVANCLLNGDNRGREEILRIHQFVNQITAK